MNATILTLCFIGLAVLSRCTAVPIIREHALNATRLLSTARAGLVGILNNHTDDDSRWSSALTAAADHRDHMEVDFICRHMGYVEMSMYTTSQSTDLNDFKECYRKNTLRRLCHIWVSF